VAVGVQERSQRAKILAQAACPQRRSSNANSLWWRVWPGSTRVVTSFQIHGLRPDSGVRVLRPQPRSRLFRSDDDPESPAQSEQSEPEFDCHFSPLRPRRPPFRPSESAFFRPSFPIRNGAAGVRLHPSFLCKLRHVLLRLVGEMPTLATGAGLGKWPSDRLAPDSQIGESKRRERRLV
jgi:hypothetical protein